VLAIANPTWRRQFQHALINSSAAPLVAPILHPKAFARRIGWTISGYFRYLRLESVFNAFGVGRK
jgi:hypothetical protein